jgi:AraC-like DNA-binding protein
MKVSSACPFFRGRFDHVHDRSIEFGIQLPITAPMTYLTCWRLQLTARSLERKSRGVAEIAADVGCGSEAAFNRGFRREHGQASRRYRSERKNSTSKNACNTLSRVQC